MVQLDFMILGYPRSGTTWAANLFTTEAVHCHHDPLYAVHPSDWDKALPVQDKITGVSCTGIWHWPEFVNAHPAKKLCIHRGYSGIAAWFNKQGLPAPRISGKELWQIEGKHISFEDLFNIEIMKKVWLDLIGFPLDEHRYRSLITMNIQPEQSKVTYDPALFQRLIKELPK